MPSRAQPKLSPEFVAFIRTRGGKSGTVWTFDDFDVLEVFKGSASQLLRVRLPGGRVEHTDVRIEGVPEFASGEETILFVERTSAGDYGITSWAQGTFRVRRQPSGDGPPHTRHESHRGFRSAHTAIHNYWRAQSPAQEFREQLAEALVFNRRRVAASVTEETWTDSESRKVIQGN